MSQELSSTPSALAEKIKVGVALFFVFAGVIGFYALSGSPTIVRASALFGGIICALIVGWFSQDGKRFLAYVRDSWREVQKVVWPTRKEALQMTGIVFVFVLVMALFLWVSDKALEYVFYDLILGWR